MAERRNLTEREIVSIEDIDLSNLNFTQNGGSGLDTPSDGGSTGGGIGVPTNLRVVEQIVNDIDGQKRVTVKVEFDGVAGAEFYEARLVLAE